MASERTWAQAGSEHSVALAGFLEATGRVAPERWQLPTTPGKWSPAEVVLHVILSYGLGRTAIAGGASMQLRVAPIRAFLSRWILLPLFFRTGTFPSGAESPQEVVPLQTEARQLNAQAAVERLRCVAGEAATALRAADGRRPRVHFTHAYFGPLSPLVVLRLLSAHTRHHARQLSGPQAGPGPG